MVDLDGCARVAGLGSALILGGTAAQSEMGDQRSRQGGSAPELAHHEEFGLFYPLDTKTSDIYAFSVLAWEVRVFMERFKTVAGTTL